MNDRSGSILLLHVGVDVGGHLDGGVAQEVLRSFQVDACPVEVRGIAVPIGYNKDKSEIPRKIKGNRICLYSFSSKNRVKSTRKTVRQKG